MIRRAAPQATTEPLFSQKIAVGGLVWCLLGGARALCQHGAQRSMDQPHVKTLRAAIAHDAHSNVCSVNLLVTFGICVGIRIVSVALLFWRADPTPAGYARSQFGFVVFLGGSCGPDAMSRKPWRRCGPLTAHRCRRRTRPQQLSHAHSRLRIYAEFSERGVSSGRRRATFTMQPIEFIQIVCGFIIS